MCTQHRTGGRVRPPPPLNPALDSDISPVIESVPGIE
jgi:hypothetical protein